MKSEIVTDKRDIESVGCVPENENTSFWRVGYQNCERIEAYEELGQCSGVPFVRITIGGVVRIRMPAAAVEIIYAKEASK